MIINVQQNYDAADMKSPVNATPQPEGDFQALFKTCVEADEHLEKKANGTDWGALEILDDLEEETPKSNVVDVFMPGFLIDKRMPVNDEGDIVKPEPSGSGYMAESMISDSLESEGAVKGDVEGKKSTALAAGFEPKDNKCQALQNVRKGDEANSDYQSSVNPGLKEELKTVELGKAPGQLPEKEMENLKLEDDSTDESVRQGWIHRQHHAAQTDIIHNGAKDVDNETVKINMDLVENEITHRLETMVDGERQAIKVSLYPEKLGEMEITLSMEEGGLTGKITVQNNDVRQLFDQKLSELNQNLRDQNINIGKIEVAIGSGQENHQRGQGNKHRFKPMKQRMQIYDEIQAAQMKNY